jgi:flagellar biosynthesis/type III secretory pathway M-ring protein FliF/YscJ
MSVEVVAETDQLTEGGVDAEEEERLRLSAIANDPANIRKAVEEFVNKDPKYTAGVIRKWMREKETVESA